MAEQNPNQPTNPESNDKPARKKSGWGRRILIGAAVLVVLLMILVLLIPTIASMGFVRSIVVGKVNDNLNGKVAIDDYSLSWTGGIDANGISVSDTNGQKVVELKKVHTDLTLFDAIKGQFNLGKVVVDGLRLNVVKNPDGSTNLDHLAKSTTTTTSNTSSTTSTPAASPSSTSAKGTLPDVKAEVVLSDCQATVSGTGVPAPITVAFSGSVNVPDINQAITDTINAVLTIGGQPAGKIDLTGTASVIKNNAVDEKTASASQKITIQGVELANANAFVPAALVTKLQGVTDGNITLDLKDGIAATLQGQFATRNVNVSGPVLGGDAFQTDGVVVTIPATTIAMRGGMGNMDGCYVKTGAGNGEPITVSLGKSGKGEELGGVQVLVDAGVSALTNALAGKAPGSDGKVQLNANMDVAAMGRMLPHVMKVVEGVQLQSGKLAEQTTVTLSAQQGVVQSATDISAITAVDTANNNKAITIQPIHVDVAATAGGAGMMDFRNVALNLKSGFASANFKGQTIADITGQAKADLKTMHDEIGQVVDFGKLDLAGTLEMTVASTGNLEADGGQGKVDAQVTLTNVRVIGLAEGKSIDQKWMNVGATATLVRGPTGGKFLTAANNVVVTFKTGDQNNPTIDVETQANVNLAGATPTAGFALQKLFVDAAKAQTEFSAFVPGDYKLTSGTINATASGTYGDGKIELTGLSAQPANLSVSLQGKNGTATPVVSALTMNVDAAASVVTAGQQQTINLSKLDISEQNKRLTLQKVSDGPMVLTMGPGGFAGNGKLQVGADLAFVNSIVQAVTAGGQQVVAQTKAGEVKSGTFSGTLAFDSTVGKPTNMTGDFKIADLIVTTAAGTDLQPQAVAIALQAAAPADFSSVSAKEVSLKSAFANLVVSDALLQLKDAAHPTTQPAVWDELQKANVAVDVPDVGQAYTIASAFMPPAAPAAPAAAGELTGPLTVSGGHATVKLNVARKAGATTVNLTDLSGGDIQLQRGTKTYAVQPFTMQLAAALKTSGSQISEMDVTQLTGKLGIADLSMDQPIAIKNPGGEQMSATGALKVSGQLQAVSDLLTVVQGSPMPYKGAYVLTEKLNTDGNTVGLAGNIDVTNLQVLDDTGKASFTEDKLAVTNDLKIDQEAKNLSGNFAVDSKVVGVKFSGGVNGFDVARKITDGTTLALNYDAAKLWQMVKPMLSKDQQASLADLQVTGVKQTSFKLGGSYPANETFQRAIVNLTASGSLPLDTLVTQGISAQQINPGFTLAGGKLTLTNASKSSPAAPPARGSRTAAPSTAPAASTATTRMSMPPMVATLTVNGGIVDLSNIVIDLTGPEMTVSTPLNKGLAHNVAMSPVLAKFANKAIPVFDDSAASGLVDVTIVRCDKLPLGASMTTANNTGVAEVMIAVSNVKPGGPIIGGIDQFAGGFLGTSVQATVQPTTIHLQNGTATISNFALAVGQSQQQYLKMAGTVALADNGPINLTATIPSDLIKRFGKDILKYLPNGVDLPITGTKENPQFASADKILTSLAKQAVTNAAVSGVTGGKNGGGEIGNIIGNVLGGNQDQTQGTTNSSGQQQAQPADNSGGLGGLLNSLSSRNKKKEKAASSQPSRRR
ncbi:MAG TPA: hypothetical protein VFE58_09465 [Tepidisphaeraceae bacterium]|nr:hypothetical protein [Tepidisphaeraceae bacterium]